MPAFTFDAYDGWTEERLKQRCRELCRLSMNKDFTIERLQIALHLNACRYRPELTHDEINAEIDRIVRGDEQ